MRCVLEDAGVGRDQEIPAWMLDAAFCRMMQAVTDPVADLRTLVALQALLAEVTATISASRPKRTTLASPEPNRGDRHGTPQRPNLDTSPSTRPIRHAPGAGTMPSWEALPQQTRRTLTGLVTRLLVEHVNARASEPRSNADEL